MRTSSASDTKKPFKKPPCRCDYRKEKRIPHLINDAAQDLEKSAELNGIQYELVDH